MAYSASQKKDYDAAEASHKKAIEIKADYAEAYSGLANVYNASRKFDEAAKASAKATGVDERGGRRRGCWRRWQRRRAVQPGRHPLERRQGRGSEEAVRSGDCRESRPRRGALSTRHGARERGQSAGRRSRVRGIPQLAPTGPNAATAKGILATIKK